MTDTSSELWKIARLIGDFQGNYEKLIGALLYLRSISARTDVRCFGRGNPLAKAKHPALDFAG